MNRPRTLYEKIWDAHVVERFADGMCLLAVDRQLIYETSSRRAFEGLRRRGLRVMRPKATLAMPDHMIPTSERSSFHGEKARAVNELRRDCEDAGIAFFGLDDPRHGIVHVVGPELGFSQPGLVMACADSHTSTHGALGTLAFGVGSSELEHILATQTLMQAPSRTMRVTFEGELPAHLYGKDMALAMLGKIGAGGGGHAIEFAGDAIANLGMAGRLTVCNMAIEAGARSGLIAPDDITFAWLRGRPLAPRDDVWDNAVAYWRTLRSDVNASFDLDIRIDAAQLAPQITWGTSPDQVVPIDGRIPDPCEAPDPDTAATWRRAVDYMGLTPGIPITDVGIDRVFIGSCTNSRLEDLRVAAAVVRGKALAPGVCGIVAPGSNLTKREAEQEGLDRIFIAAGFEWRDAGCSMCFGSPYDSVGSGERCASTSNRNFENRQGAGARTHLMSPAMAAAAGVAGHFADPRELG